ncbi:MAG TPA: helix-turn-helix transcriptional regulator [Flavobacteriales bacterium]
MPPLNARFIQVMEGLGLTGYSFSKEMETSEAVVSNIRNGKNPPNIQLVERMLKKYEEVDADWLLLGKGRMFRTTAPSQPGTTDGEATLLKTMDDRLARIEKLLDQSIRVQLDRNILVDEVVGDIQQQIKDLDRSVDKFKKGRSAGR